MNTVNIVKFSLKRKNVFQKKMNSALGVVVRRNFFKKKFYFQNTPFFLRVSYVFECQCEHVTEKKLRKEDNVYLIIFIFNLEGIVANGL